MSAANWSPLFSNRRLDNFTNPSHTLIAKNSNAMDKYTNKREMVDRIVDEGECVEMLSRNHILNAFLCASKLICSWFCIDLQWNRTVYSMSFVVSAWLMWTQSQLIRTCGFALKHQCKPFCRNKSECLKPINCSCVKSCVDISPSKSSAYSYVSADWLMLHINFLSFYLYAERAS